MRWIRALILFSVLIGVAAAQAPPTALQQGTPIEKSISGTQTHSYTVTADAKNSVQVTVEQRGVDVVVSVFSPAGKKLGEYDSPNGTDGPENVSFVVVEQGAYRIDVRPLHAEAPSGRYQIKIGEIREATEDELKASKNLETLKARALSLIGDIDGLIAELRVPQSRIKAQFQAANLLWTSDEKRAMKFITDAIAGFKELRMATEANAAEYFRIYGELTQLRHEMAYLLMTRQPEMALNFVRSTPPFKDPYNTWYSSREQVNQQIALENEIANHIARTDPKRALEVARETLKSGYSQNLMSMIDSIRGKKPELAAELIGDVVNKLLNDKDLLKNSEGVGLAMGLLRIQGQLPRGRMIEPNAQRHGDQLLSEQQQRDLLQKLANEAMTAKPQLGVGYSPERDMTAFILRSLQLMGPELDGVVSGGAAALEKRVNELGGRGSPQLDMMAKYQNEVLNLSVDEALAAIGRAPKDFQDNLYIQLSNRVAGGGDSAKAKQILNDNVANGYQRWQALIQIEQQETQRSMAKGKIDEALRNIANIPMAEERASMINQIIDQIGPGQKRATALSYLEQARSLFSPSVRAQGDAQMGALCGIARAFARYDTKRAFEIVDPLVDQLNDLTEAARVLEGFGGHYYEQDELTLNNGNPISNAALQITTAIATLSLTNFDRAKLTSDRLTLPEIRLLAYMSIAQQALQASR
jgi:hypothetical protein